MKYRPQLYVMISVMILTIISCSTDDKSLEVADDIPEPGQAQVIDIVWEALESNTSSHKRSNWQVVAVESVTGGNVVERFEGEPAPGCWSGPEPPENKTVRASKSYWYVRMIPTPATPEANKLSPTAPPRIPEPFLREAHFLVDPKTGEVVARKLNCVIY